MIITASKVDHDTTLIHRTVHLCTCLYMVSEIRFELLFQKLDSFCCLQTINSLSIALTEFAFGHKFSRLDKSNFDQVRFCKQLAQLECQLDSPSPPNSQFHSLLIRTHNNSFLSIPYHFFSFRRLISSSTYLIVVSHLISSISF